MILSSIVARTASAIAKKFLTHAASHTWVLFMVCSCWLMVFKAIWAYGMQLVVKVGELVIDKLPENVEMSVTDGYEWVSSSAVRNLINAVWTIFDYFQDATVTLNCIVALAAAVPFMLTFRLVLRIKSFFIGS